MQNKEFEKVLQAHIQDLLIQILVGGVKDKSKKMCLMCV